MQVIISRNVGMNCTKYPIQEIRKDTFMKRMHLSGESGEGRVVLSFRAIDTCKETIEI